MKISNKQHITKDGIVKKNPSKNKKFDWKSFLDRKKAEGKDIIWAGHCPNCGGKACQIHYIGVIHSFCENDDWHDCGFGGPNVHSWEQAVARSSMSSEAREKKEQQEQEQLHSQEKQFIDWLLYT